LVGPRWGGWPFAERRLITRRAGPAWEAAPDQQL
jgi:hypothetical protein